MVDENTQRTRDPWSTKKKDPAPRGVHRFDRRGERPAGWQILFTCGQHHRHKEWIGPGKSDAIKAWHSRKNRVHDEPGWCPREEQRQLEATRRAGQLSEAELQPSRTGPLPSTHHLWRVMLRSTIPGYARAPPTSSVFFGSCDGGSGGVSGSGF